MKTTGISVFVPIYYSEHSGVIEHTQTVGGRDVLRSVTFGIPLGRPRYAGRPERHSFVAWFAAMMRRDYIFWLREGVTQ